MILQKLKSQDLIHCPKWLPNNAAYLTIMGSMAYGVSSDNSDMDVYGFCLPPKELVFPHLAGEIPGFGTQIQRFEQYQEHHVKTPDGAQEYDFTVYSIVKYFHLCMENNPNMIDSLFTPQRCIIHSTNVGNMVRERRKDFLHKGAWHKFKGYAYSNYHRYKNPQRRDELKEVADTSALTKRGQSILEHGYDTKAMYHVVRLLSEVEQILVEHDLDLEKNRGQLKSIRRGEWSIGQIEEYFQTKEKDLEAIYLTSALPHKPDEAKIKKLLVECLEEHYGSLDAVVQKDKTAEQLARDIQDVLDRYR